MENEKKTRRFYKKAAMNYVADTNYNLEKIRKTRRKTD